MTDTASLWAGVRKFEGILKKDPLAYSFAPLADLYLSLGLVEDALQAARKGCASHPDFAAGQMSLARAALENSLKGEAKKALEAVVRITPENLEAQRLLADICSADGDLETAGRCLEIVSSLEPMQPEQGAASLAVVETAATERFADEEILELTDDLIEAESFEGAEVSPFSAEPERPSLGDAHRAEPFLLETPPPFYDQEEAPVLQRDAEEELSAAPVASATIAELYVNQGFPEKGAEIYREMLLDEPDNESWKKRLAELSAPVAVEEMPEMPVKAAEAAIAGTGTSEGLIETLYGWLENIGRIRECRTKSA